LNLNWIEKLKPPAFAVGVREEGENLLVYFEILRPELSWGLRPEELYAKGYSILAPEGEPGILTRDQLLGILSPWEFEEIKEANWPPIEMFFHFMFGNPQWEILSQETRGECVHSIGYRAGDYSKSIFPAVLTARSDQ